MLILYFLTPLTPVKKTEPWEEIENIAKKTRGGFLYFLSDYIFLIIGGSVIYIASRKK